MKKYSWRKIVFFVSAALLLSALMTYGYMYGKLIKNNERFDGFSAGSEALVTSGMIAEMREIKSEYPIGYYGTALNVSNRKLKGYEYYKNVMFGMTNGEYDDGYSKNNPGEILLGLTVDANNIYENAAYAEFANGQRLNVRDVFADENWIYMDTEEIMSSKTFGRLIDAKFYNSEGEIIHIDGYSPYKSCVGLQGTLFRAFTKFFKAESVFGISNLFCSIALSVVFVAISFFIWKKYNLTAGICFYLVMLFSPIITNFARNLYWVEFTWFIPVLAGLVCSVYINNKNIRVVMYPVVFISVFFKCLCGYEYISTILIAAMSFMFADFIQAIVKKDTEFSKKLFKTMCIMGIAAVLGFFTALIVHSYMRGGSIYSGIKDIWYNDVLRRTFGGTAEQFGDAYSDSINATVSQVVKLYLAPEYDIVAGMSASYFKILMLLPVFAFIYDKAVLKQNDIRTAVMYFLCFIAAISWFVLAKSHSYEHTHLNCAMWYFGFVQICFYAPLNSLVKTVKSIMGHKQKVSL